MSKSHLAPFNAKCLPMCRNEPRSIAHCCFSKHLLTPDSLRCFQAHNCFSLFCKKKKKNQSSNDWIPLPTSPQLCPSLKSHYALADTYFFLLVAYFFLIHLFLNLSINQLRSPVKGKLTQSLKLTRYTRSIQDAFFNLLNGD